jgi:CheY-like chemotaxis protein
LRSHEAGFAAHLTKPVPRERLVESIASVMASLGD